MMILEEIVWWIVETVLFVLYLLVRFVCALVAIFVLVPIVVVVCTPYLLLASIGYVPLALDLFDFTPLFVLLLLPFQDAPAAADCAADCVAGLHDNLRNLVSFGGVPAQGRFLLVN